MKRHLSFIAILAAVMLIFGGCSNLKEDHDVTGIELPEIKYAETGTDTRTIAPSLYYLAENGSKFGIETRELTLKQDDNEVEVIVRTLLDVPVSSELTRPASGLSLERIEQTNELVNVYIYAAGALSQQRKFIVSASITNTLSDYLDVPYVCVFINGEPLLINGYPYGAMQKVSENVREEYQQCVARYESGNSIEVVLPLYFLDETERYLFPEMRTITLEKGQEGVDREKLIGQLMDELAVGPKVNYYLQTKFSQKTAEEDKITLKYDEVLKTLMMTYSFAPCGEGKMPDETACASAYYTLANVMPEMYRVTLKHRGMAAAVSRSISRTMLGNTIMLYFPNANQTALTAVSRTVYAEDAQKYRTYIRELLAGPLKKDEGYASACFPQEYNTRDFHYIRIRGNTAYVDFGDEFPVMVSRMDEESEYLLFYSIVNTLCTIPRVKQVQFTINGETMETAGGEICIAYPLLPNPGLLK